LPKIAYKQGLTLLKEKALLCIFIKNANSSKEILILEVLVFFPNTLHNSTIEFPKLLHQSSLEIKRENSKGGNFMKSITLDYFFHYTVAWDHPNVTMLIDKTITRAYPPTPYHISLILFL
jgi:hypothetical protein